ncbi:unnamed protein product [Adineta steineri]|uniref:Uncharacterized protein n=1 Tax=Adineta steineri TaxID=433720 RepID=A0A814IFC9_9BILA|nr:unnamed protein product [Adineta steineri]CAF1026128.1 unnamed protein product [Adineta steineri]CAF1114459.1 unnamed protein product [Adineta steineri]CAF3770294.1 unnamed protein product [Adineta steineri]CAF3814347.1 unnamed protein product [Adineta steineri]
MSGTPSLGAFNKDKVANKFGIQLKPKDAPRRPSTSLIETKPSATTGSLNLTKNKTINDFRTNNNPNGFISKTDRPTTLKTVEPTKKLPEKTATTSKSTSTLLNTSTKNEKSNSLTSNASHSTTISKQPSPLKSPVTTKRSSITSIERAVSPAPPIKRPNTSTTITKTEAQVENKKDQRLDRRQISKPLDNTSSTVATTTATSTNSLKR